MVVDGAEGCAVGSGGTVAGSFLERVGIRCSGVELEQEESVGHRGPSPYLMLAAHVEVTFPFL